MRHALYLAAITTTASLALIACAGEGGTTTHNDTAASSSSSSSSSSTSASTSGASDATTGSESTTTTSTTTTTDTTSTATTDATTTDTTTTDTTSTTGASESCRDNQFVGNGIAADGWGLGAFCDRVTICAAPDQQAAIQAAAPAFQCALSPGEQFSCPQGQIECGPPGQAMVDDALYAQLCAALALPGLDAAYCLVLGP